MLVAHKVKLTNLSARKLLRMHSAFEDAELGPTMAEN